MDEEDKGLSKRWVKRCFGDDNVKNGGDGFRGDAGTGKKYCGLIV